MARKKTTAKTPRAKRVTSDNGPAPARRSPDRAAERRPERSDAQIEVDRVVRAVHAAYARELPRDAMSAFDVKGSGRTFGPEAKDVPNGKYRVEGGDYLYTFKGGELVLVERAVPGVDPSTYREVPSHD